jgi:hypothetical protein
MGVKKGKDFFSLCTQSGHFVLMLVMKRLGQHCWILAGDQDMQSGMDGGLQLN